MTRAWNPFTELEVLRREIDRAFESGLLGGTTWPLGRINYVPGRATRTYPPVNITEDENNLYIEALAPGLNPESLQISTLQRELTITGEKPGLSDNIKPEAFHRSERSAGKFTRTVELPLEVVADQAKADYRNGLLLITLPKAEAAKPRRITVKVG